MYRVRHYDQSFHPDVFRGGGWRGTFIVVLNWIRWKLETYIQLQVVRFMADVASMPKARQTVVERIFVADVEAERAEMLQTSPLIPPRATPETEPRARRYEAGRAGGTLEAFATSEDVGTTPPARPVPLDELAARYGGSPRARKYARGHRWTVSAVGEDFEPVESVQ